MKSTHMRRTERRSRTPTRPHIRSTSPFRRDRSPGESSLLRSALTGLTPSPQRVSTTYRDARNTKPPSILSPPSPPPSSSIPGLSSCDLNRIFLAKCDDLGIAPVSEQRQRFHDFCRRNVKERWFAMSQCGVGASAGREIARVVRGNPHFAYLDLSRNSLRDHGAETVVKRLAHCLNIVHLDLSSNDISPDCASRLLVLLSLHQSITSLNLSSHEGLNRNRLGALGGTALQTLLESNAILTCLNVAGTVLSSEGCAAMCAGLKKNSNLLLLNVANNAISSKSVEILAQSVVFSNIKHLNLSENAIGQFGCESVSRLVAGAYGRCILESLRLARCEIDPKCAKKLLPGFNRNLSVRVLDLERNPLGESPVVEIFQFLFENRSVFDLNLSHCKLRRESISMVAEGLIKNHSLKRINLSFNKFEDAGASAIAEAIGASRTLKVLDMTGNYIKNSGGKAICAALAVNKTIKKVILRDNCIEDATAESLAQLTRKNQILVVLDLAQNPVHFRYTREIRKNVLKNLQRKRRSLTPTLMSEIRALTVTPHAMNRVFEEIQAKKEEKGDMEKMLEGQQARFARLQVEENEKFSQLLSELDHTRMQKYSKTRELREISDQINVNPSLSLSTS